MSVKMEEDEEKKHRCFKFLLRILFSHIGLFLLVVGFSAFGAWLFVAIEKPAEDYRIEQRLIRTKEVNESINYLVALFWYWRGKNFTLVEWNEKVYTQLREFELYIVGSVNNMSYDGTFNSEEWDRDWTFSKSLLYAVTISSTIGYGHISPDTWLGKVATILYAVIAIPLLLVFLANIGDFMASTFRYVYSRLCCRWCRSRRKISEYLKKARAGARIPSVNEDAVGREEYMPTDKVIVPIVLNLLLISFYILLGSLMFSYWEEWDLVSSAYFTFVTLSTIGFGDYVPGNSFMDYKQGTSSSLKMLACCLYVVFGMALVSMCINLMVEQLVEKARWLGKEIGLIKENPETDEDAQPLTA
ncbi:TWiK family of potassium channels protein 7-like [Limulus polyphemus]|uniref:TWiK family of potassium channels protein 7-like n=1 Tax=Limulus polyphemus TaxID=6850 RepID=A0ABM1B5Y2_LIMPO|nr:TWiK family of potassium channels protein 7-like [Limulus polyphemus]